jgi:hypothetical protein
VLWGEYANQPRHVNARVSTGDVCFPMVAVQRVWCGGVRGSVAAGLVWVGTAASTASTARSADADEAGAAIAETEALPPPAPARRAYIQYGVAFTVEGVAHAGPVCADPSQPCILGSGGGIDIGIGWRPSDEFYIGGAYEFSKQDPNKLFRLAILQQARLEVRHYFPTGKSAEPFALFAVGLASYGNEWAVATWGPSATIGGGVEVELTGGVVLDLSLAYRPIYLRSFSDSIPAFHDAGIAHFVSFQVALEAQDTL